MIVRVALVRGSSCGKGAYKDMFGVTMPPLGLACLAGAVIRNKHSVLLVDGLAQGLSIEEIVEKVCSWGAQVVAVTITASPYYGFATDLAKRLKAKNNTIFIIAGGHHTTFVYSQVLRNGFDYAVLGEGEETFSELVNTLEQGGDISTVKSLAFKKDGKIVKTETRPLIQSLDSLPLPTFELFDKTLSKAEIFGPGSRFITMETSRGCPYNCEFCSVTPMWGHRWRFKSNERVLKELNLVKSLGYNWIFIVDDNFIVDIISKERARLFEEMVRQGLDSLNFIVQIRADLAARNPGIIKLAADAGLRIAFLGLESGSDKVLKIMSKGSSTETAVEGIRVLHKNGIITHGGFVMGAPYETKKEFSKTFEYADRLRMAGLDSAQFSIYTPLPGTKAFSKALKDNKLLTLDWQLYDCLHPVIKTQIGPFWLFFKTGMGEAAFYVKKWLADLRAGAKPSYDNYSILVRNITHFVSDNLTKYTKATFLVPWNALKIWIALKNDKTVTKNTIEILNQN